MYEHIHCVFIMCQVMKVRLDCKWESVLMCVFSLCQYIQQNIRSDCSNIDKILEPPEGQDEGVWKYEHLR